MAFVSVLDSLGKSGLLDAFNQLLEKILIDGVVSASKASQLLATHLGKVDSSRIVRDIYADTDVNQSTLLKLFCKLFADDLQLQSLNLLNTKLVDLKPTNKNLVVLKLPSLAVEIDTLSSSGIDLLISTSADLAINVQGYSSLPGNDARNPDTLCIGVLGDLAGDISLAMSHAAVMLKLGADNHFSHAINYYLSGSHEETLGEKAMCGLGLISRHPDLCISSLISMLSNPVNRFTAVEVISSQEWRLSGEIKLAREFRAGEYLHKLLLSDVEEVFRVACDKDRLAAVMEVDASLSRYEKFTHKTTTDIILFGFEIGSSSILDVDTRFVENRDGNLTIIGKMSYEEVSKSLFDTRQFNIINLHQLSNAMQTGSATLSFSASQSGDGVDEDAIRKFIRDVVRLEMVDPHDLALLDGVFQQARETEGGRHSRFLFGLSLSEAELKQLLSYGTPVWSDTRIPGVMQQICRPSAPQAVLKPAPPWAGDDGFDIYTHSTPSTRVQIRPLRRGDTISIACDAIDSALKDVPKVFKTKKRLERLFKRLRYKGSIGDAIRDYKPQKFIPPSLDYEGFPGSAENRDEQWLYFRNKAVIAFADEALLNMWAVYHSAPYSWKIERYQYCQRRTAEVISYWFDRTETHAWKIPLPGIRSEMRPMTIAMLKMLLDLADTNGDRMQGPFLSMELQILDDRAKIIKRLPISS